MLAHHGRSDVRAPESRARSGLRGLDRRNLEVESDLLTDEDSSSFEGRVPTDALILAVDHGRAFEAESGVAVWVNGGPGDFNIERHTLRDALDREVAGYAECRRLHRRNLRGAERDRGVGVSSAEVLASQVGITVGIASIDARRDDGNR